jgi:carboxyl-terminal processing protease
VRSNYVDAPNSDALLGGALEGVGDALDPFSALVPADAIGDYERAQRLSRARSGLVLVKDHGIVYVVSVDDGSPAAAAGLRQGDLVAEFDGQESRLAPLWRLELQLAGEPGRQITLRLLRDGGTLESKLTLGDYELAPPTVAEVQGLPMLHLAALGPGTAAALRPLVAPLAAASRSKLLIDLRGVTGGDADEAYAVGALFASGKLGRLDERGRSVRDFGFDAAPLWSGEIVVLVDSATLGPAEILASILHDAAKARLVGLKTFGWAGERSFVAVSGGAQLHLTTAFYAGPSGKPISEGLTPDVLVDDFSRTFEEAERPLRDLILDRGVEVLRGDSDSARKAA